MKWKIDFRKQLVIALVLLATFLLVILNNLLNKRQVAHLGASVRSVYADRTKVESFIYRLSGILYTKKILFLRPDSIPVPQLTGRLDSLHQQALTIAGEYRNTVFTQEEAHYFEKLVAQMDESARLEYVLAKDAPGRDPARLLVLQHLDTSLLYLDHLSQIQLQEARKLSEESGQIVAGNEIMGEAEFAILIVVGIIVQVILLTQHAIIVPNKISRDQLN